jgi:hypothetical protein
MVAHLIMVGCTADSQVNVLATAAGSKRMQQLQKEDVLSFSTV